MSSGSHTEAGLQSFRQPGTRGAQQDRRAPRGTQTQALVPRAFDISARVAFSASLTCTPPMPRNPPSEDASATFLLIVCSHALNPAASCGALALRMADTSLRLASEV